MLDVGQTAPEIDAEATDGSHFVLSKQQGICTIVYFFPKAFTPGCTAETRRFRDNFTELLMAGANLVGISTDDGKTQCRFAEANTLPFPLIGDDKKAISKAYDVLWPLLGLAQRITYVVGPDRKIVAAFHHEVLIKKHAEGVMRVVNELLQAHSARGRKRP